MDWGNAKDNFLGGGELWPHTADLTTRDRMKRDRFVETSAGPERLVCAEVSLGEHVLLFDQNQKIVDEDVFLQPRTPVSVSKHTTLFPSELSISLHRKKIAKKPTPLRHDSPFRKESPRSADLVGASASGLVEWHVSVFSKKKSLRMKIFVSFPPHALLPSPSRKNTHARNACGGFFFFLRGRVSSDGEMRFAKNANLRIRKDEFISVPCPCSPPALQFRRVEVEKPPVVKKKGSGACLGGSIQLVL